MTDQELVKKGLLGRFSMIYALLRLMEVVWSYKVSINILLCTPDIALEHKP